MVKQSLEILDDIRIAAKDVQEMRSEIAAEIYETCAYIQKKSQKIVEAKLNALDQQGFNGAGNQSVDVAGYLNLIDNINSKLIAFKQRYSDLKEKAIAMYKDKLAAAPKEVLGEEENQKDNAKLK